MLGFREEIYAEDFAVVASHNQGPGERGMGPGFANELIAAGFRVARRGQMEKNEFAVAVEGQRAVCAPNLDERSLRIAPLRGELVPRVFPNGFTGFQLDRGKAAAPFEEIQMGVPVKRLGHEAAEVFSRPEECGRSRVFTEFDSARAVPVSRYEHRVAVKDGIGDGYAVLDLVGDFPKDSAVGRV
jgi:hypothetical protein